MTCDGVESGFPMFYACACFRVGETAGVILVTWPFRPTGWTVTGVWTRASSLLLVETTECPFSAVSRSFGRYFFAVGLLKSN